MDYAGLARRLREDQSRGEVTVFPDGSVDTFYEVRDNGGDRIDSRVEFGERIIDDADSFAVDRAEQKPGGQAVNTARQTHALGDETRLFGHLDDPVFDGLDFETASMGAPASVSVYEFDDGDLMFAEGSEEMPDWSFSDLRAVAGDAFEGRLTADAVCCVNWVSFDSMTDALDRLASRGFDGGLFVLDPGDLTGVRADPITRLCDALGDLEATYDVVLSANGDEIAHLLRVLSVGETDDSSDLADLRERVGIAGVVRHGKSEAAAATADGRLTVPNVEADGKRRQTGSGDRFTGGLAHGLAAGWEWENALGLGNLCASYHVETGETGTGESLAEYADQA
ncbi:carbohydrate kinase family protein [Halogeometricum sp. S1BR25-6]|uniref:Carbohydrate kinase family protein n=1 Tax=Halogeometricum salsisoli TaxID=2950536 RepID=A0ABU2GEW4_9EURY|nr:carbohydrate kinase family protein [Halogeometricum sp. S1BR25-6]MDS0299347.1 carbohydrate kinase family protein [Halogeometricum sp. S1BR25-6]